MLNADRETVWLLNVPPLIMKFLPSNIVHWQWVGESREMQTSTA